MTSARCQSEERTKKRQERSHLKYNGEVRCVYDNEVQNSSVIINVEVQGAVNRKANVEGCHCTTSQSHYGR